MKTIHTFFIFIALLFSVCFFTQISFAEEPAALNSQDKIINPNPLASQETEKQIQQNQISSETDTNKAVSEKGTLQDKTLQNQKEQIKKDPLFPVAQEPVPGFGWGDYFQGIGIMLLLLFVFWYILKLMRKYGNGRFLPNQRLLPRDSMYLEGQLPLGQGKSIVIVNVLGDRLVLGVTEKNINLLSKTGTNHAETFEELMEQVPFKNTPHA